MADLGSDIAGVFDVDATLSVATGLRALAQAILRRITTPLGQMPGAPSYGYDVRSLIGSTTPASIAEQRILQQVRAEEEVADARCTVAYDPRTAVTTITISVVAGEGPFDLTVSMNGLTLKAFFAGDVIAELQQAA
jgi:phage baseplate assembly protein W